MKFIKNRNEPTVTDRLLGQGAFGQVYLGKYKDQEVEVKKLDISFNSLSKEQLNYIKNELEFLNKLNHPNIIKFIASQQSSNDLLIIMEYANGGSLTDYISKNKEKGYDWNLNYQFIFNITEGLKYLHQQNIVHRDLKSMNILISNNKAKLADFGIYKSKNFQTQIGEDNRIGTVRWMAPEILTENKPHTFTSDVYSLGMIIWELVAKCTIPFKNIEERFIANNYCRGEREEIPTDTPFLLKEIINGCWQEIPEQRITLKKIKDKIGETLNTDTDEQLTQIEIPPKQ